MAAFLESCVTLGLVTDEGGTETTNPKIKKDIEQTDDDPLYLLWLEDADIDADEYNNTSAVYRRTLRSQFENSSISTNPIDKRSISSSDGSSGSNNTNINLLPVQSVTAAAVSNHCPATAATEEDDDRDRSEKRLMIDDAEWPAQEKKRIIVEATEQALLDGGKHWKIYGIKLLRLIAKESTLLLSNSTIQSMDEKHLIFACMKPYAPLINKLCIVKGLSSRPSMSIWNNRTVLTTDYKESMFS